MTSPLTPFRSIDLNADLGEHSGDGAAADAAIMSVVTSASIACGAHAGSPEVMRATVMAAMERGVVIGAHPGYPDRDGFGRRDMDLTPEALIESVTSQIRRLDDCCTGAGARMRYVKPHGALYNRAGRDAITAQAIVEAVRAVSGELVVLALSGGRLVNEARRAGLTVAREAFIDRAYMPDGTLVARDRPGALIDDPRAATHQALGIAQDGSVEAIDGSRVTVDAESLCVHGDNPSALSIVTAARNRLELEGVTIQPFLR